MTIITALMAKLKYSLKGGEWLWYSYKDYWQVCYYHRQNISTQI